MRLRMEVPINLNWLARETPPLPNCWDKVECAIDRLLKHYRVAGNAILNTKFE